MERVQVDRSGRSRVYLPLWLALLGFALLIGLCTVTDIDLSLSARFYDATATQGWILRHAAPWIWLYRYGEYPGFLMAIGAACFWVASFGRQAWAAYRRHCLLLVLAVALGPGLLVNGILKPLWDRPRPRHVLQFGGSQAYRSWWQPGGPGSGRSFPSGHAAMGYSLIAWVCLISRPRLRLLVFSSSLGYGTLVGVTRVVQGGHFASDVVWSGALMCGVVIGLQKALGAYAAASPQSSGRL